jgi:hypothetical protein
MKYIVKNFTETEYFLHVSVGSISRYCLHVSLVFFLVTEGENYLPFHSFDIDIW